MSAMLRASPAVVVGATRIVAIERVTLTRGAAGVLAALDPVAVVTVSDGVMQAHDVDGGAVPLARLLDEVPDLRHALDAV